MNEPKTSRINERKVNRAYNIVNELAHPRSLKILQLIEDKEALSSTQLAPMIDVEQPAASRYLMALKMYGYLKQERNGKGIKYRLNYKRIQDVNAIAVRII